MKRITITLIITCTLFMGIITAWIVSMRPCQSKVLAHGYSPEGREYCIVQTFKGLTEPYQVSFYIRDPDGIWRWNYLEHEDNGWKSAKVSFSQGLAAIERNGQAFKEMEIPSDSVDLAAVLPGYRDEYCPSDYSVEDVLVFHNRQYED